MTNPNAPVEGSAAATGYDEAEALLRDLLLPSQISDTAIRVARDHMMHFARHRLAALAPARQLGREALNLARPIVEADLHDAIDHADADWEGMSRTALDAIDAILALPAREVATGGGEERAREVLARVNQMPPTTSRTVFYPEETVIAAIRLAFAAQPAGVGEDVQAAWLIERRCSPPLWIKHDGAHLFGSQTSDVQHAHRYPTKRAAQKALATMAASERGEFFVSEHLWIDGLPATQPEPVAAQGEA